jgi:KaiC/GvpD/RAD55 family RecA-like ATPase
MRDLSKLEGERKRKTMDKPEIVKTGITGFDELITGGGIPKGATILISGGPGTGKTIFCLQILYNAACNGHECLYITFEEPPERLRQHMRQFGWEIDDLEEKGLFTIKRLEPFNIARTVEAQYAKISGTLKETRGLSKVIPDGLSPYIVAVDSVTALESAFTAKPESYRLYIEQLFKLFEESGATTFFVAETDDAPIRYSRTGVEEFLADGVVVLYNAKVGDTRVRAIELLKLRGAKHITRFVPLHITEKGIEVFSTGRIFGVE